MGILNDIDDTLAAHAAGGSHRDFDVSGDAMRWQAGGEGEAPEPQPESLVDAIFGDATVIVISGYTRADAIADGVLVEVPEAIAREAGFIFPIALTQAAWEGCAAWTDADSDRTGNGFQSESGRLWDVLWMTRFAIGRAPAGSSRVPVELRCLPRDRRAERPDLVELVAVCGPGDDAEPVITISYPHED